MGARNLGHLPQGRSKPGLRPRGPFEDAAHQLDRILALNSLGPHVPPWVAGARASWFPHLAASRFASLSETYSTVPPDHTTNDRLAQSAQASVRTSSLDTMSKPVAFFCHAAQR
jgi:hypothetical protein